MQVTEKRLENIDLPTIPKCLACVDMGIKLYPHNNGILLGNNVLPLLHTFIHHGTLWMCTTEHVHGPGRESSYYAH